MAEREATIKCSKCGLVQPATSFSKGRRQCKACVREYNRRRRQTDAYKEYQRRYRQTEAYKERRLNYQQSEAYKESRRKYKRSEAYKERHRKYKQSEAYKEYARKYGQKYKQSDGYYARLLTNGTDIKKEDVPQELIALKRLQIELHREVRKHEHK